MDFGNGLAIDAAGNAYVTGTTKSSNFPTTGGAFDRTPQHPGELPALRHRQHRRLRLQAERRRLGAHLLDLSRGGTDIDSPRGIAVDGAGNAYVAGETLSTDFPTTAGRLPPHPARQTTTCSSRS